MFQKFEVEIESTQKLWSLISFKHACHDWSSTLYSGLQLLHLMNLSIVCKLASGSFAERNAVAKWPSKFPRTFETLCVLLVNQEFLIQRHSRREHSWNLLNQRAFLEWWVNGANGNNELYLGWRKSAENIWTDPLHEYWAWCEAARIFYVSCAVHGKQKRYGQQSVPN